MARLLTQLKERNPRLFWDGVGRGNIPYSAADALYPGGNYSNADQWVGGPQAPRNYSFDPDTQNPLGSSGVYPTPWLSFAQGTSNASYTYLGAYAKMIGFEDCSGSGCESSAKCCTGENSDPSKYTDGYTGIWGRLGQVQSGSQAGEWGFYPMNRQTDTTGRNTAAEWNTHYERTGDDAWLSKEDWWKSVNKEIVVRYLANTGIKVRVQVATGMYGFNDPEYYKGMNLNGVADYSHTLLVTMIGVAAAARWIF